MSSRADRALLLPVLLLLSSLVGVESKSGWQNPETTEYRLKIHLVNGLEWRQLEPKSLLVKFDRTQLSGKMTLSLLGYSERNATKISKLHLPFTMLASTELPDSNKGELDVLKLQLQCRTKEEECNLYDMGFMQIAGEMSIDRGHAVTLVSPIVPLGWFVQPLFKKAGFTNWSFGKCRTWYTAEPREISAAIANVSCPTELTVAKSDPGWFLYSTYLAGLPAGAKPQPDQECFYSAIEDVPASMHAAPASLCCYRTSDSGLLQKEFVTKEKPLAHGSSVLRSHPFGSDYHTEHYLPGHVPYLSHWYWDIMPHIYCCYWWTGNACSNLYLKLRPPPQMKKKAPGSQAGYVYASTIMSIGPNPPPAAFCSKTGEFWLIRSAAIEVQIRYYVISEYIGPKQVPNPTHYSHFRPAGSKSAFLTALAVRSMELPHKIVEIICPEGEYRTYVQVTDTSVGRSSTYNLKAGGGIGTKLLVSEHLFKDGNRIVSILAKHSTGRVGITAYIKHPGDEFFNLFVTVTNELAKSIGGLIKEGTHCSIHKIEYPYQRLFREMCDHCSDFDKYSLGRPIYFTDFDGPEGLKQIAAVDPRCNKDSTCEYMVWSTNFFGHFYTANNSKTMYIDKLMPKVGYTGVDVCQRPNITGLNILETQKFTASSVMQLTCMQPFRGSAQSVLASCKNGQHGLTFSVPNDFICAESAEFTKAEKAAAAADQKYTKDHYTPVASKNAPVKRIQLSSILCSWILLKIIYNIT